MGESNGTWGQLTEHAKLAEAWDGFERLPEPGANPALDTFVARKRISYSALVRIGARLAEPTVLVFAGPGYLKFRDLVTDRRWSFPNSDWSQMRIVPAQRAE